MPISNLALQRLQGEANLQRATHKEWPGGGMKALEACTYALDESYLRIRGKEFACIQQRDLVVPYR